MSLNSDIKALGLRNPAGLSIDQVRELQVFCLKQLEMLEKTVWINMDFYEEKIKPLLENGKQDLLLIKVPVETTLVTEEFLNTLRIEFVKEMINNNKELYRLLNFGGVE